LTEDVSALDLEKHFVSFCFIGYKKRCKFYPKSGVQFLILATTKTGVQFLKVATKKLVANWWQNGGVSDNEE
jgi:hypothetical protein